MNLSRTIVFAILFLIVMAVYIYEQRLARQFSERVPDEIQRTIFLTTQDQFCRIEICDHSKASRIELFSTDKKWNLTLPVQAPADVLVVNGLVSTAKWISQQPRLRAEKEWEEYGLARPPFEVNFELCGPEVAPSQSLMASPKMTLQFGVKAPVGNAVYARWSSERGYFLLPAETKSVFEQSVYGMREKRLFWLSPGSYRKIFVEMGNQAYEWKKDAGEWFWLEPVSRLGQKASPELIQSVLNALQGLYIKEFLDENQKSKAELGFFMIHDRILVESDEGEKIAFHFGNEVPVQNAYYGFREGEKNIFLIDRGKVIQFWDLLRTATQEAKDSVDLPSA